MSISAASRYDVREYGASGDGATLDTAAVQRAVDAAGAAGGGTVVIPAGSTVLVGSVTLRSNVELHIQRGATLQASRRWADYTARFTVGALSAGVVHAGTEQSAALITARDAAGVAITGGGVIDGAGASFATGVAPEGDIYDMPNERPFLVFLIGCRNVTVHGVTLRDAALWTLRLTGCEDVLVHGLRIRSDPMVPNADGIDLDRCRRVRICDCDIDAADDAISLKTCDEWPEYGPCEDVTVTGCTLASRSSALVVGVDVSAPIRRIVFSSCVIRDSHRGLSVSIGTGSQGSIQDVLFSDMVVHTRLYSPRWWGSGEPVFVRAAAWHGEVGTIRDIRFRNVLARGESGAVIWAERPGLVQDVLLDGVRLELARETDWPGRRDLRPAADGGPHEVRPPGIHVENASGVVLRDCQVRYGTARAEEFGTVVEAIDCSDLDLGGLATSTGGAPAQPS